MTTSKLAKIKLSDLTLDSGTQVREVNRHVAADYAEAIRAGAQFPPITVYQVDKRFLPTDGFHRIKAYEINGDKEIACEIFDGTRWEAQQAACGANWDHGRPRTNADKRKAVIALLREPQGKELSDRAVAEICKVSHSLVADIKKSTGISSSWNNRKATVGRDGKRRRASTLKPKMPALQVVDGDKATLIKLDVPPIPTRRDDDPLNEQIEDFNCAAEAVNASAVQKNGQPRFDDLIIDKLLGKLVRALDDRARAYGGTSWQHSTCVESLNQFKEDWDTWKKSEVVL